MFKKSSSFFVSMLKERLDAIEITNQQMAYRICRWIPAQCPFEREVQFMGRRLFRVPSLCHFNRS